MNILIVGTGMYVCGKNADNYDGTILPAVYEFNKIHKVSSITFVSRKPESIANVTAFAQNLFTCNVKISGFISLAVALSAQKYDACILSVPDHLHAVLSEQILAAKCNLLVVKPMALSFEDAVRMYRASKSANVVACVEFHKRFDEANLLIKNKIQRGDIGTLQYANVFYSQKRSIPLNSFRDWASKTNIFQYLGVHYVDLIYWMTGCKVQSVIAWGQKDYLISMGINTYDSVQAAIEWRRDDGKSFITTILTSWVDSDYSSATSDQKLMISGDQGKIYSDQKKRGIECVSQDSGVAEPNPYFSQKYDVDGIVSYNGYGIKSVVNFLTRCVPLDKIDYYSSHLDQSASFYDGVVSSSVIEAVTKSLNTGNKINLDNLDGFLNS